VLGAAAIAAAPSTTQAPPVTRPTLGDEGASHSDTRR